jgi:hypothetical protein
VESVATGQSTDIIFVVKIVEADSARIARGAEHFWWRGSTNRIIFVVFFSCFSRGGRLVIFGDWSENCVSGFRSDNDTALVLLVICRRDCILSNRRRRPYDV